MREDFLPTASLQRLEQRAVILKRIRAFFEQRHFLEVETPILSHDIVVDRYIEPISIPAKNVLPGSRCAESENQLWLQTSPEFSMKRLLAAGAVAVYQISKAFRSNERGRIHNPEFSMLEWYRAGDDMQTGMALLSEFACEMLGQQQIDWMTYQRIFEREIDVNPHDVSIEKLQAICEDHGIETRHFPSEKHNRDFWLNLLLTHVIEQKLGFSQPVIVYDWPASQSALAIVRHDDPPVAERFELYVNGIEIANGYHELLDADELSSRNSVVNQLRLQDGNHLLPEESRLIAAMRSGIPACAGVALGVDRLVMLMTGATSIDEVIAFPFENA